MVIASFAMDAVQPVSDVFSFNQEDDRLEKPEHCPKEVYTIMRLCWEDEPREQPMFK